MNQMRCRAHVVAQILILRLVEFVQHVQPTLIAVFADQLVALCVLAEFRNAGRQNNQLAAVRNCHTRAVDGLVAEPGGLKFGGIEIDNTLFDAVLDKVDVLLLCQLDSFG